MNVGRPTPPIDAAAKSDGSARYASDVDLPRLLHAAVVRSDHPHARIVGIETHDALRAPGVVDVLTARDIPRHRYHHLGGPFSDRAALADDVVRFVGEEIAVVAAETLAQARAARRLIRVRYRARPAATTPGQALAPGAPLVHDHVLGNVAGHVHRVYGDPDAARRRSVHRAHGEFEYARAAHAAMETHAVVASWDPARERLDLWVSSQAPYFVRHEVAHVLELDLEQVHTYDVAVGGSFGAKAKVGEHEVLAAALSMRTGRPVRIAFDRDEEFAATKTRHAYRVTIESGISAEGTITDRHVRIVADNGAYNHNGPSIPGYSAILAASLYRIGGAEIDTVLAYTNTEPGGSFRGYGNPQITFAMESQVDELADAAGLDPLDVRIASANRTGDTTLAGWRLSSARLVECLEAVRSAIDWDAKRPLGGSGRGVGVAAAIHVSGANAYEHAEESAAAIELDGDSRLTVRFAGSDAGTGQRTVLAQIAADELGLSLEQVDVAMMASEDVPRDLGAWSSRGTFMGGHAVIEACAVLRERLGSLAAAKFGVDPAAVAIRDGGAVAGDEQVAIGDLVALADDAIDGRLRCEGTYRTSAEKMDRATGRGHFSETYSFVAQAVEVDVDMETGRIEVVRVVTAHDSGRIVNPTAAESQALGAVVMGLGAALGEELLIEGGRVVNQRFVDYALPRPDDLPPIDVTFVGDADPTGPRGAKGIGEIGLVPTPAAVANAVAHATGVRIRSIPLTPDKVRAAIEAQGPRPAAAVRPLWRRPRRWWVAGVRAAYPHGVHTALHRWGTRLARPRPVTSPLVTSPVSLDAAIAELDRVRSSAPLAGGTDAVPGLRDGTFVASTMVAIGRLNELAGIEFDGGSLRIGGGVTLDELARRVADTEYQVLADAVATIATPQVRSAATIAGNLCQANRCWFFRNGFTCYKRGGVTCPCYAVTGDHRFHHAVIDGHRCQAVTPSDLATVFGALHACCEVRGPHGRRTLAIDDLYHGPGEVNLRPGEIITAVELPATAAGRRNQFRKLSLRSGDFALVAAATSLDVRDGRVRSASVVIGGVAPVPFRARRVEAALVGVSPHDRDAVRRAASAWVRDAHPLARNGWKLATASTLVARCVGA